MGRIVSARHLWLAALVVLGACSQAEQPAGTSGPRVENGRVVFPANSPQLAALTIVNAETAAPAVVKLPGRLLWDEERTARIFPAFGGRVLRIDARPGDVLKAGQPLAHLSSPEFGDAQALASKAEADLALARKNLARVKLLVDNGVAPQKDLAAAEAELADRRAEHAQATARIKLYGGSPNVDASLVLTAPIAGTVVERNINPGQEVRPDMSTGNAPALFVITDPTRLWLGLDATERDLPLLAVGNAITFRTTAYPGESFTAKIIAVSDFVDPQTRTIKLRCAVDNRDRRLKGEMFVTGELQGPPRAGVTVPAKAVFLVGTRHYVFVEETTGRFARAEVDGLDEKGGPVLVTTGLRKDQRVVVEGSLFLQQIFQQKGGEPGARR